MLALYVSLALLGLAAIDPIGIGIMPILLIQNRPYKRALIFLSGSFVSLMVMGLLFAKGLGQVVLRFERHNHWFVPTAEVVAGMGLLMIAIIAIVQLKTGKSAVGPSGKIRQWLKLGTWHLFFLGILLVVVQSLVDIVFVVAMVRIGQFHFSNLVLITAVATYAITAIALQLVVVTVFKAAPQQQKEKTLQKVHKLLAEYSNQAVAVVSLGLSCLLFAFAVFH